MGVHHAIWSVGDSPKALEVDSSMSEKELEDMIVKAPSMLSNEWMIIGQQIRTDYNGVIDLLAIAPDASLVLIELKKGRTPRDVVAQAIDYASWLEQLSSDKIAKIYKTFNDGDLAIDFKAHFHNELDEEELNQTHQIVVVASSLDASTERIVTYLHERNIAINVLFFKVFKLGNEKLLSRTWFTDPADMQVNIVHSKNEQSEPWNGEFYASFGDDGNRNWNEAVQYGFISAGGGRWYTRTLESLKAGDRVWVNIPNVGYVGVGEVTGNAILASDFYVLVDNEEKRFMDIENLQSEYHRKHLDDPEMCEYFVPMKWMKTVSTKDAIREIGLFGNQHTICRPTVAKWRHTIDRLKTKFKIHK